MSDKLRTELDAICTECVEAKLDLGLDEAAIADAICTECVEAKSTTAIMSVAP